MNNLEIATNSCVIITAVMAIVTLALKIVKELVTANPSPFRRKLEYLDRFGDYIVNNGNGLMKITKIKFYYEDELVDVDSLVQLFSNKLTTYSSLEWTTYLKNDEIIGRVVNSHEELKLVEINPIANGDNQTNSNLFDALMDLRKSIKIEIKYTTQFGIKKKYIK